MERKDQEMPLAEGLAHILLRLSALLALLIKKGVITEEEFEGALDKEYSTLEKSSSEEEEEEESEEEEEGEEEE